jgi:hypothetical protein
MEIYLAGVIASALLNTRYNSTVFKKLAEQGYTIKKENICGYKEVVGEKLFPLAHLTSWLGVMYGFARGSRKVTAATAKPDKKSETNLLTRLKQAGVVTELSPEQKAIIKMKQAQHKDIRGTVTWWRIREKFGLPAVSDRVKARLARNASSGSGRVQQAAPQAQNTGARQTGQQRQQQPVQQRQAQPLRPQQPVQQQQRQQQQNPPLVPRQWQRFEQGRREQQLSDIDKQIAELRAQRARLVAIDAIQRVDGDTEALLNALGYGNKNNGPVQNGPQTGRRSR